MRRCEGSNCCDGETAVIFVVSAQEVEALLGALNKSDATCMSERQQRERARRETDL